jgi:hypothetical protein
MFEMPAIIGFVIFVCAQIARLAGSVLPGAVDAVRIAPSQALHLTGEAYRLSLRCRSLVPRREMSLIVR